MSELNGPYKVPPKPNEIEISVFGPGYGESLAIHVGDGAWMVVDSCVDALTSRPQALRYLEDIGVDFQQIKLVVATHWHDDHIRGISEVFRHALEADFWCSAALQNKEWMTLVQLQNSSYHLAGGSGVAEMHSVMQELRIRKGSKAAISPKFLMEGSVVPIMGSSFSATLTALAPAHAAILAMHSTFKGEVLRSQHKRGRIPSLGKNDGSIVLGVSAGDAKLLLGGDLEERSRPGLGWLAVLDFLGKGCEKREGFKIAHHGSENGDHEAIWSELLREGSWAVVTPWKHGSKSLPTPLDVDRILKNCTGESFITASIKPVKYRHPDAAVRKTLGEMNVTLYKSIGHQGQVRLRREMTGHSAWKGELFGNARTLSEAFPVRKKTRKTEKN